VCLSSSLGECFESNLFQIVSSISRVRSFHVFTHWGQCAIYVWGYRGHIYTHLVPLFFFEKKKKCMFMFVLKFLVDLRVVI
jgi:hypothetical protein